MSKIIRFWDMHSGGSLKLGWGKVLIEAKNEVDGVRLFNYIFDRSPFNVTCDCCGADYVVDDYENITQATGYFRDLDYNADTDNYDDNSGNGVSLSDYLKPHPRKEDEVLFICEEDYSLPENLRQYKARINGEGR